VAEALKYGAATAALKRTIDGDLALIDPEEVERVVADTGSGLSR
jgi:2-dehydro-3-deoxygluconokinase